MQGKDLRIGMIGFGEAAERFARELTQSAVPEVVVYTRSGVDAPADAPYSKRAAAVGARLVPTPRALCEATDLIIALTPGRAALAALRAARPHLRAGHIYVDASTSSVKAMEQAGRMLAGRAGFVDAAIMNPVPQHGLKVNVVASGSHAAQFRELMAPRGMCNIQVISDKPGAACAMKLIRSVCMKGLSAVVIESLEAAQRYGVLEVAAADIATSIDERPFAQHMKRSVCGTAVHSERRVNEMGDALALLRSLGSSTRMTRATRAKLIDITRLKLREQFAGREPDSIVPVIEALAGAKRK